MLSQIMLWNGISKLDVFEQLHVSDSVLFFCLFRISRISVVRRIGADLSRFFSSEPPASVGRTTLKMLTNEKCRNSVYPRTKLNRFNVPDLFLKWETDFPDYTPISYTSDSIKGQPWADPEYVRHCIFFIILLLCFG